MLMGEGEERSGRARTNTLGTSEGLAGAQTQVQLARERRGGDHFA